MSEDNRASGSVKRREIKPKGERPQGDRSGQSGGRQPSQGAEGKSRQPRSGKGSGGQRRRPPQEGARKPQSQQSKDKNQTAAKPQSKPQPKPQARPETQAAAERTQGAPSQSRKKSGRNRRGPKRFPKDQDLAFRGEETVEDVVRDIRRIEKDIQIDLDSIRNQKLDL